MCCLSYLQPPPLSRPLPILETLCAADTMTGDVTQSLQKILIVLLLLRKKWVAEAKIKRYHNNTTQVTHGLSKKYM